MKRPKGANKVNTKIALEKYQHTISLTAMIIAFLSLLVTVYLMIVANNIATETKRLAELESPVLLTTSVNVSQQGAYNFSVDSDFRDSLRIDSVLWVESVEVSVLTGSIFSLGVVVPRSYTTHRVIAMPDEFFSEMEGAIMPGYSVSITVHEPLLLTPNNYFAYTFLYAIAGNGTVVTAMQIYINEDGNILPFERMFYNVALAGGNNWIYDISENPSDSMLDDANVITEHFREIHRLLNEYK